MGRILEEKVTELQAAKKLVRRKTSLMGKLSSSEVVLIGTYEEIKEEDRRCLEELTFLPLAAGLPQRPLSKT